MADRPRKPRKTDVELRPPSTDAGGAIVESILIAAERTLQQVGADGFTTNAVAEHAGVSVGSLYQYFPNKQAILAELARRVERRTETALASLLESTRDLSLVELATRVVDALCDGIGGLTFRHVLLAEVPDTWTHETSRAVDHALRERVRELLASRADIRDGDREILAWVVSHSIEGVIESAVRARPDLVTSPEFRSELVELVVRYLRA